MTRDLFVVSLVAFPVVLVIGYGIRMILRGRDLGPFTPIVNALTYIGVFFHELSHYTICILTGVPAGNMSVRLRNEQTGEVNPNGEIVPRRPDQQTLLQTVLVALGPVLVGTWIVYFSLNVAFSSLFDPLSRIIAGILVLAVLLASTPSPADFKMIRLGFNNDPKHSFYQLFLISLSILLAWWVVIVFRIVFPIEFLYYFIIIGWYITLKYSLIIIRWGVDKVRTRFGKEKYRTRFRRFSRRRYKSSKFR